LVQVAVADAAPPQPPPRADSAGLVVVVVARLVHGDVHAHAATSVRRHFGGWRCVLLVLDQRRTAEALVGSRSRLDKWMVRRCRVLVAANGSEALHLSAAPNEEDVMVLHDLVLLPEPPRFSLPRLRASRRRHSVRIDRIRCDASDGV